MLALQVAGGYARGAQELPPKTSLGDPSTTYSVPGKPYVVLRRGELEAVVVDNRDVDDDVLPGHRAGYHGIASLKHTRQRRNIFVPAYAGLNFEHIHDGTEQAREILFEPRNAPMQLRRIDEHTAELYQPPTPHWKLESCMRYELLENGLIRLTFECIPRAKNFKNDYIGLFWASYIDKPDSLDIHFMGRRENEPGATIAWIRGATPAHGELATHVGEHEARAFAYDTGFPLTLVFNRSHYRYASPWYFGVCRDMAFVQMFRAPDAVRFSQSPSGGGTGCPAWDFQWFIEKPRVGTLYQLVMHAAYLPLEQPNDLARVRTQVVNHVEQAQRAVSSGAYFPPPESKGGWRQLTGAGELRAAAGVEPSKLDELRDWLLRSDDRDFAAVMIRNGYRVLEVERGNSASTDSRRVASVSKAICATVLAIASERSQQGLTPRRMKFSDPAFDFIPWAQPLSDSRKTNIQVAQLLNHTSGICPEATGAPNDGSWEYILGLSADPRTAKLAFDPGTACGYSTHALDHAALVCENVTGKPYDQFAIEALFQPLGIEHWSFQFFDGGGEIGRHPSHGLGMPARDLARIGYCMLRGGEWDGLQVIPRWFVSETARPTHNVRTPEMRWQLNAQVFSHGWELPALHDGQGEKSGEGIPEDARYKPGSGGQLLAFVPSLDLVISRQTGSSGDWAFEEYLRRACRCVIAPEPAVNSRPNP
jgi:CubicO group peptidase (beta-lactamase class C family)